MNTAIVLLAGLLSALADIPGLIKNKSYKELIIFSAFLTAGIGIFIASDFGVLPSPSKIIEVLIHSMIKIKFSYH